MAIVAAGSMWGASANPDVAAIIARSVEANDRDWKTAPEYTYFERDRGPGGSTTWQVSMILGSPYRKLVAWNGHALPPEEQANEQHKLEETIAERREETLSERSNRVAEYERDRRRDHLLLNQLTVAFNFRLLGQQRLGPHTVFVLQATPRPGYTPPNREAKVLTGMEGKLWMDTRTFQWVKVEAQVIHPVWIEGFLARVDPGTRFELEYAPVTNDIWLPTHFEMRSRARILFVFPRRDRVDESYFGYERAAASETVAAALSRRLLHNRIELLCTQTTEKHIYLIE